MTSRTPGAEDQDAVNEREWARPENWTGWLGTYRSELDDRIWVPKRWGVGWTPNVAHRQGRLFLASLFILPVTIIATLLLALALR